MRISSRFLCTAIATLLVAGANGFGQTATTEPVGFISIDVQPGYNAVGPNLVNASIFQGGVASTSGSTITYSTTGTTVNLSTVLNASKRYYLEITKPNPSAATYLGDVLEIDVAATIASANNVVTIKAASYNTLTTPLPDLTGYSAAIRPHVTIGQAFGTLGNILLKGAGSSGSADRVLFFDRASGGFTTYWFRANAGGTIAEWRSLDSADTTDYSSMSIEPGIGVFVVRQPGNPAVKISFLGSVRTNDLRKPLAQGFNLLAQAIPSNHSPAMLNMTKAGGFTGAGSSASADRILFYEPVTGSYTSFWFRANASGSIQEWRSTNPEDTTNYMNSTTFFDGAKAVFLQKISADADFYFPVTALNLGN